MTLQENYKGKWNQFQWIIKVPNRHQKVIRCSPLQEVRRGCLEKHWTLVSLIRLNMEGKA